MVFKKPSDRVWEVLFDLVGFKPQVFLVMSTVYCLGFSLLHFMTMQILFLLSLNESPSFIHRNSSHQSSLNSSWAFLRRVLRTILSSQARSAYDLTFL